jgi:hypothetical protein
MDLAVSKTITFEIMRLQRISGAVLFNDAKACYNRIVENISNITLLREGLQINIASLHAQTFHSINYFIKHKYGVGPIPHQHNNPEPIYGVGQGSTDASARWGFISDVLIRVFNKYARDAYIYGPLSHIKINPKIAGFIDDIVTLLTVIPSMAPFISLILQRDP